jgi:excisionase family DNA binding protein
MITKENVTITQAARLLAVTRGAIQIAVRNKRIPAQKKGNKYEIKTKHLQDYLMSKHSRRNLRFKGELVYDKEKGEYSVTEVACLIGCDPQEIYHACRTNKIKSTKKNSSWVIHIDDVKEFEKLRYVERLKIWNDNVFGNKCLCERCGKKIEQKISYLRRISG